MAAMPPFNLNLCGLEIREKMAKVFIETTVKVCPDYPRSLKSKSQEYYYMLDCNSYLTSSSVSKMTS